MKQKTVDEYINNLKGKQKTSLEHVRKTVIRILPEVEELISYQVPAFKYRKRILIYYAAFANHMSIYPASDEMIKLAGEDLAKFRTSKGTLRFTTDNPIPDDILEKIIAFRKSEIDKKY